MLIELKVTVEVDDKDLSAIDEPQWFLEDNIENIVNVSVIKTDD